MRITPRSCSLIMYQRQEPERNGRGFVRMAARIRRGDRKGRILRIDKRKDRCYDRNIEGQGCQIRRIPMPFFLLDKNAARRRVSYSGYGEESGKERKS